MTFNRIVAEACYVSSRLCSSKGDYKNAARHARQAVLLNRRIWAAREDNASTRKGVSANSSKSTEVPASTPFDPLTSLRDEKGAPLTSSITHEALKGPEFWTLVPALYRALTQHSIVIASQGMLEEAVYVLQQAQKVASAIGSRTLLVDHASRLADLWIQSGRPDKAQPLFDGLDMSQSPRHMSTVTYHLSLARMHHVGHRFDDEMAEYDTLEKLLQHLSSPSYISSRITFTSSLDALTNKVSSLTLEESKPAEVQKTRSVRTRATAAKAAPKTVAKTTTRTARKAPVKSAPTAVSKASKKTITPPAVEKQSAGEHCASLDAVQAEVLYRRVATYLLQEDVAKAIDVLSKVERSEQDREGSHAWVRFKAMLAQAITSISDDFTFNTLPESTIAFPSIPPKDRRSSEGVTAKRPAVKPSTKLARSKKQAGDNFVELIENARERLVEAHAQHATAASNHVFRQICAALSHATVLLSAVSQGRIRGSIHPLYSAYMSGMYRSSPA
jgi:separase